jgi:diphosphomevalonate decarboxylase
MSLWSATAVSCPNIAFIKYWGNRNAVLRLPSNGSISMNLDGLYTRTRVKFDPELNEDTLSINGAPVVKTGLARVQRFMGEVRQLAGIRLFAQISSENNFPIGAGIASSASAFAALSLAASRAAGLDLLELGLSRLARRGSGSACRSIPDGFVEWQAGTSDKDSYAFSIAPAEYWLLADVIAVLSTTQKTIGSSEGHALAGTSPLQPARVADAPHRLDFCRQAILHRDFSALAKIVELDSNLMHAVMITSQPPLFYWAPASITVMQSVIAWRKGGLPVCYTLDAGPNVHVICPAEKILEVANLVKQIPGVVQVLTARVGGPTRLEGQN